MRFFFRFFFLYVVVSIALKIFACIGDGILKAIAQFDFSPDVAEMARARCGNSAAQFNVPDLFDVSEIGAVDTVCLFNMDIGDHEATT